MFVGVRVADHAARLQQARSQDEQEIHQAGDYRIDEQVGTKRQYVNKVDRDLEIPITRLHYQVIHRKGSFI